MMTSRENDLLANDYNVPKYFLPLIMFLTDVIL